MFPKTLFTVFDSAQSAESLRKAVGICEQFDCHLSVAIIGIALPVSAAAYGAIPADAWAQEREDGLRAAADKANELEQIIARAGISGDVLPYYCDEGQIPAVVGTRARYADLALSLPSSEADSRLATKAMQGILFQSARPMLHVPDSVSPTLRPKRVMLAWNSQREAASAAFTALDTLIAAETVHVAMVDPVATEYEQGEEPGNDVAAYLARHGVNVTVDVLAGAGRPVAETLVKHAADIEADLIIAGAYGHSRIREYFFGGTTNDLLANERFPLLMAH